MREASFSFNTLSHEASVGEATSSCKFVLQSDWFARTAARFELKYRLANLFLSLSKKLQLDLTRCEDKDTTICCEASLKTRAVLFGSCTLQVIQTINMKDNTAIITLHWIHPLPDEAIRPFTHVTKGLEKRTKFIRLFNSIWSKQLKTLLAELIKDYECSEYDGIDISPGGEAEVSQFSIQKTINDSLMKSHITKSLKVNNTEPFKEKRLVKTSSSQKVTFSNNYSVHELSLSRESREARMGLDGSAVFSDGKPKPLVSVKTGALVWPIASTEERKKIAPFNFSENENESKLAKAEDATSTLPLKKRPLAIKIETDSEQENSEPADPTVKRKGNLRRSSSSKRLRREDSSVDRSIIAPFNYSQEISAL